MAYPASLAEAYEETRLWTILMQKKAATTSMALVAKSGGVRVGRGERGLPKKGSPPPKSLKKKVKFTESKSTDKVDMTVWLVPA